MGRGSSRAKGNAKPAAPRKSQKHQDGRVRDLEKRLAESLEREKAAGEILRVISSSPASVQPTFEAIARAAMSLCEADIGCLFRFDGQLIHVGAFHGTPAEVEASRRAFPQRPGHASVTARAIFAATVVQIDDVSKDPEAADTLRAFRTVLSVPMIRDGRSLGAITVARRAVRPFSDEQIELVETFADQAVIAIENVRLFTETREALEQQTATSEILRVISSSPTDVQPVFDAVAASAARLCEAVDAAIFRVDGDALRLVAHQGAIPAHAPLQGPPLVRGTPPGRAVLDGRTIHITYGQGEDDEYPEGSEIARRFGHRAALCVPLLRAGQAIGVIAVRRTEARPFTDSQIALLETFADQAVIAIENVRLFNETKEALERQTATAEILRVISSSPTDIRPVFDTIAEAAMRLCGANSSIVTTFDGELLRLSAQADISPEGNDVFGRTYPLRPGPGFAAGRAMLTRAIVHIDDVHADTQYEHRDLPRSSDFRAILAVPMLRNGLPIGTINVHKTDPGFFPERQIALLQTFADQAVIAIENVRLFTELQEKNKALTQMHAQVSEALEQQTATSEILRVISQSQTDVGPVFEAIVDSAVRLLRAYTGTLTRVVGEHIVLEAFTRTDAAGDTALQARFPVPVASNSSHALALRNRAPLNVADAEADPRLSDWAHGYARVRGYRSQVVVPLLRQADAIGTISVTRREPGGFETDEIALIQTFADQAVIAIENVRLFTELQEKNRALTQAHAQVTEALERQTATAEILRIIASSPTDLQPALDAMAESATRLCASFDASIFRLDGEGLRQVAHFGPIARRGGLVIPVIRGTVTGRSVLDREIVSVADLQAAPDEFPEGSTFARQFGFRSYVSVPLLREGAAIGAIGLPRTEVRPFSDEQISLLQTFADQAVIAIENVRLFTELETRNRDLTEALDRQTATADILRVISQSQTEVQPVFDAIVDNAMRLFRAWAAAIVQLDGELLHMIAVRGGRPGLDQYLREQSPWSIHGPTPAARSITERTIIHVPDTESDRQTDEAIREIRRRGGMRSVLAAPMLRDGQPIGAIWISRAEAGRFSSAETALLQTFADQAVIAIENTRLLGELRARTGELTRSVEQLTALGEVGRAISSTLDLETVLTAIVSRAVQLSGLDGGVVFEYDESAEEFVQRAQTETGDVLAEVRRTNRIRRGEGVLGQTAITLEPVQVADIVVPGAYTGRLRENLIESGIRAILAVPMVYEGRLIGCLGVTRNLPGSFPAETVELLRTFATQSALAIQNARLFREIEDKSRQLEAASQHKSEFLANMSHELRTPLNAIIGFSEVMSDGMFGELNEKQQEYSQDIHASGQHLLSLINDILDLSKIEAGRMELELTDVHLPTAIDNALTLVRERAGRRAIALQTRIDERLGQIRADERKIRQVVLNLLSNAIKFTPEGGRIEVTARPSDGSIEVSVTDTGIGIAPEDQEAVFEEFRQVGRSDKKAEGTGLGLTLCRKFIELHGGRIWVKSEVGHGSTFTFRIPMRPVE